MKRLFLLVLVAACATTPSRQAIPHTILLDAPFEEVWVAMVEVLGDLALPIETLEKDSGRINTGWFGIDIDNDYVDCGRGAPGDLSHFSGQIDLQTRVEDQTVTVDITSRFRASMLDPATTYTFEVRCHSTGGWESLISTNLANKIGGAENPRGG